MTGGERVLSASVRPVYPRRSPCKRPSSPPRNGAHRPSSARPRASALASRASRARGAARSAVSVALAERNALSSRLDAVPEDRSAASWLVTLGNVGCAVVEWSLARPRPKPTARRGSGRNGAETSATAFAFANTSSDHSAILSFVARASIGSEEWHRAWRRESAGAAPGSRPLREARVAASSRALLAERFSSRPQKAGGLPLIGCVRPGVEWRRFSEAPRLAVSVGNDRTVSAVRGLRRPHRRL